MQHGTNHAGVLTSVTHRNDVAVAPTAPQPHQDHSNRKTHYSLSCLVTGASFPDDPHPITGGFLLDNPEASRPGFLRTDYSQKSFDPGDSQDGLFRFRQWLPIRSDLDGSSAPVTFREPRLSQELGLSNLYLTFSGYWPEIGAAMPTGTFKETEAYAVYGRLGTKHDRPLVVASAGNTARAFLHVATMNNRPLVVVVPEANIPNIWTVGNRGRTTIVVAAGDDADYSDAIALSNIIASLPGYVPEGGAKNVARRDGMSTTMLSATHEIGRIPDHYFQAVGSGTGAIAAWEANGRLIADGRYGDHKARLHLAQNAPFQPITDSWLARSRNLMLPEEPIARSQISLIGAKVLANRKPPYSPVGGLFDALADTEGAVYGVTNTEAARAAEVFERVLGTDLSPAAAVAAGALLQAVEREKIAKEDTIMLNLTGGGIRRAHKELNLQPVVPDIVASRDQWTSDVVAAQLDRIWQQNGVTV